MGRMNQMAGQPWLDVAKDEIAKTASYTVLPGDNGNLFTNTGAGSAVTFTLPAVASGYVFQFLVIADKTVTVASAEGDNIVVPNDASADSIAFDQAGDKVGAWVELISNAAGTKWYLRKLCPHAMTIAT